MKLYSIKIRGMDAGLRISGPSCNRDKLPTAFEAFASMLRATYMDGDKMTIYLAATPIRSRGTIGTSRWAGDMRGFSTPAGFAQPISRYEAENPASALDTDCA